MGAENAELGLALLGDHELFGRVRRPVVRRGGPGRALPSVTLEFQPGELVVHVDHGVARFQGIGLKELDGTQREYLELEYAEGDRLFVPVESLDRVKNKLRNMISDLNNTLDVLKTAEKNKKATLKEVESVRAMVRSLQKLEL